MTVTFVTAFLDLQEDRPKDRPTDVRFELFKQLNATGIRLHVFISPGFRDRLPSIRNGVVETISLEELDIYPISPQGIPDSRSDVHDTRNFLILMNAKIEFVKRAIRSGHHSSTHYAWADFNLYHVLQDPASADELRALSMAYLPPTCMFFPGCWKKGVLWDSVNWRFCGGFFLGDVTSLNGLYDFYLNEYPRLPKLTWEVNVWAYFESLGFHFDWYPADHTPSILHIPRNVVCDPPGIPHAWASYDQRLIIGGSIYRYVLECIRPHALTAIFPQTDGFIGDEEYHRMMTCLGRVETVVRPAREYARLEALAHPTTRPLVCLYATHGFTSKSMILLPWDDTAFTNGLSFPQRPWSEKIQTVMWRGGSSGFHRPSVRMRVVEKLFDVPNTDVRFVPGGWPVNDDVIPPEHFADKLLLGPDAHSRYKYVLIIDGNTQASNGHWGFALGSVPILITHPESRWWFKTELIPMVNYVPVNYHLSDLVEKIEWLVNHDDEARVIAENALKMSQRVFSPMFQRGYINNRIQQILQQDR
jgi:hypothetical protein